MRVLVACEESQAVTIAFRELGHEAYSCDLLPCSGGFPEWHLQCDALQLLKLRWDLIIAFPPCTYLSNAGARHLYPKGVLNLERYEKGMAAKDFFLKFLNADCPRIAVENPVSSLIFEMPKCSQEIQPYFFGAPYRKKTRLWLRGLPCLKPTKMVEPLGSFVPSHTSGRGVNSKGFAPRGKDAFERSKTFPEIAAAMAAQWGTLL